ncbi:MAG: hypothetical protein AB7O68_08170 [Pirellulales bacterium]
MNKLLSLQEAAVQLGYSVAGLRQIVARSRRRRAGAATVGPVIRFIQAGRGSPIRFEQSALDEFKARHTVDPGDGEAGSPRQQKKRRAAGAREAHGFEAWLLDR